MRLLQLPLRGVSSLPMQPPDFNLGNLLCWAERPDSVRSCQWHTRRYWTPIKGAYLHKSHLIGSTGVAGEPTVVVNPPAPKGSRAEGDDFVHYIEDGYADITHLRFWFLEEPLDGVLAIDFEVLVPVVSWLKGEKLTLGTQQIVRLISMVFFQEFTGDAYKKRVNLLSFREVGSSKIFEVPYPQVPISKHEIAG